MKKTKNKNIEKLYVKSNSFESDHYEIKPSLTQCQEYYEPSSLECYAGYTSNNFLNCGHIQPYEYGREFLIYFSSEGKPSSLSFYGFFEAKENEIFFIKVNNKKIKIYFSKLNQRPFVNSEDRKFISNVLRDYGNVVNFEVGKGSSQNEKYKSFYLENGILKGQYGKKNLQILSFEMLKVVEGYSSFEKVYKLRLKTNIKINDKDYAMITSNRGFDDLNTFRLNLKSNENNEFIYESKDFRDIIGIVDKENLFFYNSVIQMFSEGYYNEVCFIIDFEKKESSYRRLTLTKEKENRFTSDFSPCNQINPKEYYFKQNTDFISVEYDCFVLYVSIAFEKPYENLILELPNGKIFKLKIKILDRGVPVYTTENTNGGPNEQDLLNDLKSLPALSKIKLYF
ncbi:MAG: hypothetical protein ACRCZ2_07255 [Fusobacteriaceae bacterium]